MHRADPDLRRCRRVGAGLELVAHLPAHLDRDLNQTHKHMYEQDRPANRPSACP